MADRIKVWLERIAPSGGVIDNDAASAGDKKKAGSGSSGDGDDADGGAGKGGAGKGGKALAGKSSATKPGAGSASKGSLAAKGGKAGANGTSGAGGKPNPTAAQIAAIKLTAQEKAQAAKAQAAGLRDAAAKGVPFCEECEKARQALAAQWRAP